MQDLENILLESSSWEDFYQNKELQNRYFHELQKYLHLNNNSFPFKNFLFFMEQIHFVFQNSNTIKERIWSPNLYIQKTNFAEHILNVTFNSEDKNKTQVQEWFINKTASLSSSEQQISFVLTKLQKLYDELLTKNKGRNSKSSRTLEAQFFESISSDYNLMSFQKTEAASLTDLNIKPDYIQDITLHFVALELAGANNFSWSQNEWENLRNAKLEFQKKWPTIAKILIKKFLPAYSSITKFSAPKFSDTETYNAENLSLHTSLQFKQIPRFFHSIFFRLHECIGGMNGKLNELTPERWAIASLESFYFEVIEGPHQEYLGWIQLSPLKDQNNNSYYSIEFNAPILAKPVTSVETSKIHNSFLVLELWLKSLSQYLPELSNKIIRSSSLGFDNDFKTRLEIQNSLSFRMSNYISKTTYFYPTEKTLVENISALSPKPSEDTPSLARFSNPNLIIESFADDAFFHKQFNFFDPSQIRDVAQIKTLLMQSTESEKINLISTLLQLLTPNTPEANFIYTEYKKSDDSIKGQIFEAFKKDYFLGIFKSNDFIKKNIIKDMSGYLNLTTFLTKGPKYPRHYLDLSDEAQLLLSFNPSSLQLDKALESHREEVWFIKSVFSLQLANCLQISDFLEVFKIWSRYEWLENSNLASLNALLENLYMISRLSPNNYQIQNLIENFIVDRDRLKILDKALYYAKDKKDFFTWLKVVFNNIEQTEENKQIIEQIIVKHQVQYLKYKLEAKDFAILMSHLGEFQLSENQIKQLFKTAKTANELIQILSILKPNASLLSLTKEYTEKFLNSLPSESDLFQWVNYWNSPNERQIILEEVLLHHSFYILIKKLLTKLNWNSSDLTIIESYLVLRLEDLIEIDPKNTHIFYLLKTTPAKNNFLRKIKKTKYAKQFKIQLLGLKVKDFLKPKNLCQELLIN